METEVKWYRVIDPLSPLYGCDVSGWTKMLGNEDFSLTRMLVICAMRRVDVFVGDRPFQLVAPEGETLGLLIDASHLEESPLQDDVVELATDLPYGKFLEEIIDHREGLKLHLVAYENVYQVALIAESPVEAGRLIRPGVIVSRTINNLYDEIVRIRESFNRGDDVDDIKYMIERAT